MWLSPLLRSVYGRCGLPAPCFVHRTNRKLELRVEDKQVYSNLRVDLQHSPQEIRVYSFLWVSCDELRCGMDASQYKDYVLVMLFIKYISDKYAGVPFA